MTTELVPAGALAPLDLASTKPAMQTYQEGLHALLDDSDWQTFTSHGKEQGFVKRIRMAQSRHMVRAQPRSQKHRHRPRHPRPTHPSQSHRPSHRPQRPLRRRRRRLLHQRTRILQARA